MKKSKILMAASMAFAVALCLGLAGCGGASGSSSAASDGSVASSSSQAASASASSEAGSSSSASASSGAEASGSSASTAADYTASNGTLDCEYVTLEVIGQGTYDDNATLELRATNKTDHAIYINPAYVWTVNGAEAYGGIAVYPEPGETIETTMWFTDASGDSFTGDAITDAAGTIQIQGESFNVLDSFDFSYTA